MKLSQEYLIKIVERSSTITERLGSGFTLNNLIDNNSVNSKIDRWIQVVGKGNPDKFFKRLEWDNFNLDLVQRALSSARLSDEQNLPAWLDTFKAGMEAALSPDGLKVGEHLLVLGSDRPFPFQELCLPFIGVARQKLIAKTGTNYHCITAEAHTDLEWILLGLLADLNCHPMELKFSAFRARRQSSLSRLLGQLYNSNSKTQYQAFIKQMLEGEGLLAFFQEYPVLARLVATVIDFWVETIGEFLQRLATDLPEIQRIFQPEQDLGEVVSIQSSISDPHNHGRSVMAIAFASGLKLIYKPKSLDLDAAYFQLLNWCNQHFLENSNFAALPEFKLLKVINNDGYGWVEFVEYSACKEPEQVKRYYQRAGMLLCLLYILGANDCHNENLIACGEHPVLIDLETLMYHPIREFAEPEAGMEALSLATKQLGDSVLRTGLLPRWDIGPDGQGAHDLSGLGGVGEQETSYVSPKWNNINTDSMNLGQEAIKIASSANAPVLDGVTLPPDDYVQEIVDGFAQMYRFLSINRQALLEKDSPLMAMDRQQVRCVFRATQVYASVRQKSLLPKYLRDGAERSIELDILTRPFIWSETKHPFWAILKAEIQALECLDIPFFAAYSDSDRLNITLMDGDKPVQVAVECFTQPSYQAMLAQFQQMNDDDLAKQIAIIHGSFYSKVAREPDSNSIVELIESDHISPLSTSEMLQQAVAIAQELQQRAIRAADGSITWIGLGFLPQASRFQLQPIEYGLYDGSCGVAFFLAALFKVTGDNSYQDLSLRALKIIRNILSSSDREAIKKFVNQVGIGGANGLGSIIYSLVQISKFFNDDSLLEDAKRAASLISSSLIAADRQFDILGGVAGAIQGLVTLYQATNDRSVLLLAISCGEHLLNNRISSDICFRSWGKPNEKPLTGFSHGAAGIAYTLLRLYEVSKEVSFLEAAEEAIAYERSLFCPDVGNWPDLRSAANQEDGPSFMVSWCHGAPGIGLARLGSLAILDNEETRKEIDIALNTTQNFGLQDIDHPCCGNCGRLEVLLVGAQKLLRPDLLETVQKQASLVVQRAKKVGGFHLFPQIPRDVYNPGFFQGTAGIGYEFLRLAYPDLLPSVLLWEI